MAAAAGATGLAAWGVAESRRTMINFGAAAFAVTVLSYYFSHVMDMRARSTSLIGLGLLFLAGGWTIERVRRNRSHFGVNFADRDFDIQPLPELCVLRPERAHLGQCVSGNHFCIDLSFAFLLVWI